MGLIITPTRVTRLVFCSSDVTTTSLTPVDITGLVISVGANTEYHIHGQMKTASTDTNGIKYQATGPASPTQLMWRVNGSTTTTTTFTNEHWVAFSTLTTNAFNAFAADGTFAIVIGLTVTGSTAGTIQMQFQKVTAGTATVYAGSWLAYTELTG